MTPTLAAEYKDSHSRVDVTEITVNGDDALASLARIDSNEFSLVLRDLEDRRLQGLVQGGRTTRATTRTKASSPSR